MPRSKKRRKTKRRRRGGILGILGIKSLSKASRRKKRKPPARTRQRMLIQIRNLLILGFLIFLAGGLVFVGVKSVLELKTGNGDTDPGVITMQSEGDVVGLVGVPAYPGSEFMYEENIDEAIVQQFLSEGNSAYVLPPGTLWEEVVEYYKTNLGERGYSHLLSVEFGDEERRPGEYWVFEVRDVDEDGKESDEVDSERSFGLRIYSKINGIWYEKLTLNDARTGLSSEVAQEKEIELLLAMGSMQDLPKSFPWKLEFPELWDVNIKKSRLMEAPLAEFASLESDGMVTIEPIAFDTGNELADEGETFLEEVNSRREEGSEYSVLQTSTRKVAGEKGLRYDLTSAASDGWMMLVVHPGNGIVYAVTSFGGEEAFFNYVVENLEVK